MSSLLVFPDARVAADALTFARRAVRLGDGALRLRAEGGVLAMTCAPLAPRGLFDSTPTILGMRTLPVDAELICDLVIEAEGLTADTDATSLRLPESAVTASWAGVSPPRSGWEEMTGLAASTLASRAQWGIAAVAEAVPADAGEDAVRVVRAGVWGVPDDELDGLPLGVGFTAFALGFIGGDERARVFSAATWTRISLTRGHILVRGPVRTGLTSVRSTGSAG